MKRIGLCTGSFDPPTYGHLDLFERARQIVDELVIGVGVNIQKTAFLLSEVRQELIAAETGCTVIIFKHLAIQAAQSVGACALIRGIRSLADYEHESTLAYMNHQLAPHIETLFLPARADKMGISSTLVREIWHAQGSVEAFVPPRVAEAIRQMNRAPSL